jgi:hypothetical protein
MSVRLLRWVEIASVAFGRVREGDVTDWATKPQPVEESRWCFPLPSEAPEEDLVNVGGDLQPSTVVNA